MSNPEFTAFMATFERHLEQTTNFQANFGNALQNFAEHADAKETAFQAALRSMADQTNVKNNSATSLPERFDGAHRSQEAAKQFITGLESYFRLTNPGSLTDERKINIAVSRLKGAANTWIDPYELDLNTNIHERSNEFLMTWEGFRKEFMSRFGDPQPTLHAYEQLCKLEQTGSVAEYTTQFRHLYEIYAPDASSREKYYPYRQGLKIPIRAAIAARGDQAPDHNNFEGYIKAAICTDEETFAVNKVKINPGRFGNRSRNYSEDRQHTNPRATAPSHNTARSKPMDLSAMQSEPAPKETPKGATSKEREYRRKNNLCFYCGGKHKIASCSKRPSDGSFRSN